MPPPFPGSAAGSATGIPVIPGSAAPPPMMAPPPGGFPFPMPMMPFPLGAAPGGPGAFLPPPIPPSHFPPPSTSMAENGQHASDPIAASIPIATMKFSYLTDPGVRQPTTEEQNRTIFIGEVPDALDDFWLGQILKSSGEIASWVRLKDSLGKPKQCALVEFESIAALSKAVKVLQEVVIPGIEVEEGEAIEDDEALVARRPSQLRITYSDETKFEISEYNSSTSESAALKGDEIKKTAANIGEMLQNWLEPKSREEYKLKYMADHPDEAHETATFDFSRSLAPHLDDEELADIPAEQRAAVVKEIAAFRERANQRERERIEREEEVERKRLARIQEEKIRNREQQSASPMPGVPTGPSRMRVTSLSYSDPLEFSKSANYEEEKEIFGHDGKPLTDEEIEERRKDAHEDDLEAQFIERERRYIREENLRLSNAERELRREREDKERYERNREILLKRYADWDDDEEAAKRSEEYYYDRAAWIRNRALFRSREAEADARESELERRARGVDDSDAKGEEASSLVNSFLDGLDTGKRASTPEKNPKEELRRDAGPIRVSFKKEESPAAAKPLESKPVSIGFAKSSIKPATKPAAPFKLGAAKKSDSAPARRPAALGDDDEEQETKRRKLIPLSYDKLEDKE